MDTINTIATTENTTVKTRKPRTVAPKLSISDAFTSLENGTLWGFSAEYGNRKAKRKVMFLSADGEAMAFAAPDAGKSLCKQDYAKIKHNLSIIAGSGFDVDVTTF